MSERLSLCEAVAGAWSAFERSTALSSHITPSIPILFFGDMDAYRQSKIRTLTVGLNPSSHEFPADSPFQRFPLARGIPASDTDCYLNSLSAYFRAYPYRDWFSAFEPTLNGLGVSYYEGQPSTALHTDICSPVATDPTWSNLNEETRKELATYGVPL